MNPEIKERWLDALRSGEYQQGQNRLRQTKGDTVTYCCLGVLCDLHRKMTGLGQWDDDDYVVSTGHMRSFLPDLVQYWADLNSNDPIIPSGAALSSFNHDFVSFQQIAEIIENEL